VEAETTDSGQRGPDATLNDSGDAGAALPSFDAGDAATVTVSPSPGPAISDLLYGVNYEWNLVSAAQFSAWNASMTSGSHYMLMRYPSGWNAEHYTWGQNQEVAWSTGTGNCYDPAGQSCANDTPGASPATALAAAPKMDFIVPSALYVKSGDAADLATLVSTAQSLVTQYGSTVPLWEIGNEWWNQGSSSASAVATRLSRYATLVAAVAPAMKAAAAAQSATIEVYATIDWQSTGQVTTLMQGAADAGGAGAWAAVDGISIHPYCGNDPDAGPTCDSLPATVAQIVALSGKPLVYASEWSVSESVSTDDDGMQNANLTVQAFGQMARAGVHAAAYWPGSDFVVGVSLVGGASHQYPSTATGLAFGWLSQFYEGQVLTTGGDLPAIAAVNAGQVTILVPTGALGTQTVWIPLAGTGLSHVVSAEVLYAASATSTTASVASLPTILQASDAGTVAVGFVVNPGSAGRGSTGEIARITLSP
jgi:hypothetical protein